MVKKNEKQDEHKKDCKDNRKYCHAYSYCIYNNENTKL